MEEGARRSAGSHPAPGTATGPNTDGGAAYLRAREDRLAWILGSSRSGSTWLLRMLTALEGVTGIDDPHLGHHLGVWRPIPLAWAVARERPELATLDEVKREKPDYFFSDRHRASWMPALRELVLARFGAQLDEAAACDEPTLVVKEPGSQAAGLLLSLFPGSRLVFLLRDGRDVVDSWLDAYQRGSWAFDEGAFDVARHGRLPLIRWLADVWRFRTEAVREAYRRHPPERRVVVRYEELRAAPQRELARICGTLGLEVARDRIDHVAAEHSYENVSAAQRGPGREIRSAQPGSWRQNLDEAERAALLEVVGPLLEQLGYGADPQQLAA